MKKNDLLLANENGLGDSLELSRLDDGTIEICADNPWAGNIKEPPEVTAYFRLTPEQAAALKAWL